jgi:hypothetical protein
MVLKQSTGIGLHYFALLVPLTVHSIAVHGQKKLGPVTIDLLSGLGFGSVYL